MDSGMLCLHNLILCKHNMPWVRHSYVNVKRIVRQISSLAVPLCCTSLGIPILVQRGVNNYAVNSRFSPDPPPLGTYS